MSSQILSLFYLLPYHHWVYHSTAVKVHRSATWIAATWREKWQIIGLHGATGALKSWPLMLTAPRIMIKLLSAPMVKSTSHMTSRSTKALVTDIRIDPSSIKIQTALNSATAPFSSTLFLLFVDTTEFCPLINVSYSKIGEV